MQSSSQAALSDARRIAADILSGKVAPNVGCAQIEDIAKANDFPEELQVLALIAHEQHGHGHIGIMAESCIPDIMSACQELIDAQA